MISELGLLPLVFRVDAVGGVANGGASGLPAAAPVDGFPTALPSPGGGVEIWDPRSTLTVNGLVCDAARTAAAAALDATATAAARGGVASEDVRRRKPPPT